MFEKITPEQAGVSSREVAKFIRLLNKRNIPMHSLLMMKGDKLFAEYYWAPFHKDFNHREYSQTKSFTSVAIGLLWEDGLIDLDRPMAEYFPEKIDTTLPPHLAKQTVREMLTMTTVGECARWFDEHDEPDRTHLYFNLKRKPGRAAGTIWDYDSAGSQVLSNLVEKISGMSTFDFLNERIFKHLGTFRTAEMLRTRNGDGWGDSAMICTARDIMSFARFVMNYGTWEGKRLMGEEYLRLATSKQKDNIEYDRHIFRQGYGYQIWRTENNGFCFYGMGSQYTVCLPDLDLILVCNADTQGMVHACDVILGMFFDIVVESMGSSPLPEDKAAEDVLAEVTRDLKLVCIKGDEDSPLRDEINGTVYRCFDNPQGIKSLSFRFDVDGRGGELHYENAQGAKVLPFRINENTFCKFPQLGYSQDRGGLVTTDGSMYNAAVSAAWLQEDKIGIRVQIIDRYFGNGDWIFAFKGDDLTVRMTKSAEDFLDEYVGQIVAVKEK